MRFNQFIKQGFRKRRRGLGKTSISETRSPYTNNLSTNRLKSKRSKRTLSRNSNLHILPPSRLSQNKIPKIKKILIGILLFFSFCGIIYVTIFTDYFVIDRFQVYEEGTEITDNLNINSILNQQLRDQNILVYNETSLIQTLLQENPEYGNITVHKILPDTIEVNLEKYPIAANIINLVDGNDGLRIQKKFMVNSNGMIIMENEENPDLPYIRLTTDQPLELNSFPLDQKKLKYITSLVALFEEKFGIRIIDAVYYRRPREVHLRTEKDFTVWFDIEKDPVVQIEKLKKALPKLDIYNTPLDYIDLRIAGTNAEKVIYKKK